MLFIFISYVIQNQKYAKAHAFGGKKKALDKISYWTKDLVLFNMDKKT